MIDSDEVLARWRARGFDGGVWVDPPGREWRDFVHGEDELLMVLEGRLALEIDGAPLAPATGEEVLIPAGARHTVRNIGGSTARWAYAYRR